MAHCLIPAVLPFMFLSRHVCNVNGSCPDPKLIMFLISANPDMVIPLQHDPPPPNPDITIHYIRFLPRPCSQMFFVRSVCWT